MHPLPHNMKKIFFRLFSTSAAGLYMILFALAIGIATFIENDFGTSAAQKVIFKARWFELLLLLFSISILVNIFRYRMIQQRKWATLTFHASIILILLGAAVTRYLGYEGIMHIREDNTSNAFISAETYVLFEARQHGKTFRFDEKVLFATLGKNTFKETYQLGEDVIEVELAEFIPNPENVLEQDPNGVPVIKVVVAGTGGREEYYLKDHDFKNFNGTWFNFGNPEQTQAVNIYYRNDSLVFKTPFVLTQMQMATQQLDTVYPGSYSPLMMRSLYSNDRTNFVIGDFSPAGKLIMESTDKKLKNESIAALRFNVRINGEPSTALVYGMKGMEGTPQVVTGGHTQLAISYGAKKLQLPFSIKLRDFILDKYPGTNSASSYASEVTLIDKERNISRDQRIYMNNILDHRGYRFFQSSFDQDELGTVLSVNHDFWGTWISYAGYFFLTLGLFMTFFSKKSRFRELSSKLREMQAPERAGSIGIILMGMFLMPSAVLADNIDEPHLHVISKAHAESFGRQKTFLYEAWL